MSTSNKYYHGTIIDPLKNPLDADPKEIRRLYWEENESMDMIAKKLGCSRPRLGRWMEFWGIERRTAVESMRLATLKKTGSKSGNYKGGFIQNEYHKIYLPEHPRCQSIISNTVYRSVLIAEKQLKRYLKDEEMVHHKNLIKGDDNVGNLCVMQSKEHKILHNCIGNVGLILLSEGKSEIVFPCIRKESVLNLAKLVYQDNVFCVSGMFKE